MSHSQPADARAALMTTVILRHSLASAEAASPSQLLRKPSRNANVRNLIGHQNQSDSASKRQDKSPFATRGRTIYNAQDKPAALSSPKTSGPRRMKPIIHSSGALHDARASLGESLMTLESLQRMDAEEEEQQRSNQCFLVEARPEFTRTYYADEEMSVWMGTHCLTPERNGSSRGSTPFLSPSSSTTSASSDMEYSPHHWNAPVFSSGEGDLEAMFDRYIKEEECLEDGMRF
ncbi:hypothetical protein M405DRAFT_108091 [Rhizopogon salebrosus TDB-379]|nr:hypothetical protein M405DRAFT_108091 [Rhizopogon salebrosus TDB-379]